MCMYQPLSSIGSAVQNFVKNADFSIFYIYTSMYCICMYMYAGL